VEADDTGASLQGPVGLAISHPGHELRLSHLIRSTRPTLFILTAGSRSGGDTRRVEASRTLAQKLGAQQGGIFGRYLDRDVYEWIIARDPYPFIDLAAELADGFVQRDLRAVITDSWQLYNVVHDLWHLTVRAAATSASTRLGHRLDCLDYPVVPERMAARTAGPARLNRTLSAQAVTEKLRLAAEYPDISEDVDDALRAGGRDFVASENLYEPRAIAELLPARGEQPPYELFGEARVAAGLYDTVLRWRHAEPIVTALSAMIDGLETVG
jgi:hypothetical protein